MQIQVLNPAMRLFIEIFNNWENSHRLLSCDVQEDKFIDLFQGMVTHSVF